MKWRDRRRSSNVEDRRLQQARSGMNLQAIIPIARFLLQTKIGRIVLIVGVVAYFLGFNPLSMLNLTAPTTSNQTISKNDEEQAKFIATVLAETEDVWNEIFAKNSSKYVEPNLVLFRGAVNSGCGFASSQVGPFYCPNDQKIYIDLSFFSELAKKYNAPGDFANAYVLAHEVGHHVQYLTGTLKKAEELKKQTSDKARKNAIQVKVELQADCYAGIWAHYVHFEKNLLEDGDIDEALNAASKIGDDALQKKAQGYVVPDSFTHGTSKQRKEWFYKGFTSGKLSACSF